MSDYDSSEPGFFDGVARFFGTSLGIAKLIILTTACSLMTCGPAYYAWTTRGELEKEAREGVIVTPLEYRNVIARFPSLGYKLVLENISDDRENLSLGEIVYKQKMLEQQKAAITNAIHLKAKAIEREKIRAQAIEEFEIEQRNEQLLDQVGEVMEISKEDQADLRAIIQGID